MISIAHTTYSPSRKYTVLGFSIQTQQKYLFGHLFVSGPSGFVQLLVSPAGSNISEGGFFL
jgi:hypothetical protein